MQANLMGDAPASEMEWNEPFFRDCFDNVTKVVTCDFVDQTCANASAHVLSQVCTTDVLLTLFSKFVSSRC
jgi:hypothetical protein